MSDLLRRDEVLRQLTLPEVRASEVALGRGDVLVMCAGFEDRALDVLARAVGAGSTGFRVVEIEYQPAVAANRATETRELAEGAGAELSRVVYDRENPVGAGNAIVAALPGTGRLVLDVSGMSRLLIVQLVVALLQSGNANRTVLVYVEAADYPPTREEVEAKLKSDEDPLDVVMFVSSGVFGLTIVPELSSVAMQGQPLHIVVFPSWNTMQFAAVLSEIQGTQYTIVHGVPPRADYAWRRESIADVNRVRSLQNRTDVDASTLDYRETVGVLLDVYGAHGAQQRIIVAPVGSKMQAVAVGVVRAYLKDIQIVYPTPRSFAAPEKYTRGVRQHYQLDLGGLPRP